VTVAAGTTGFEWRERDGVSWLAWEARGVTAAFPARKGGVSAPPLDSLNLGLSVNDAPENVLENRRRFCAAIGLPPDRLVVPGQVHGTTLAWVGEAEAGRGAFDSPSVIKEHDGLLTRASNLGLVISYADCVPIVIVADGEEGPGFATVHAGWRGMIAGIAGMAAAELGRGALTQVFIEGDQGYVVLVAAGERAVLTCIAGHDSKLGLVLYDMREAAESIAEILG
jgi:copper oxidase (laccase) domain-containing protein